MDYKIGYPAAPKYEGSSSLTTNFSIFLFLRDLEFFYFAEKEREIVRGGGGGRARGGGK